MHPPTWPYRRPPPPPPPSPRTSTRALHPRARTCAHAHTHMHIRICMHLSHVRRYTTHAYRDRAGSPISVHSTARAAIHTAFCSALPPPTTCAALWRLAELQWQVSLVISIARAVICVARIRTISYPYPRYSYPYPCTRRSTALHRARGSTCSACPRRTRSRGSRHTSKRPRTS